MHASIYRQALAQSWRVVWHNKILWVFGLLAAFLGQFGLSDFLGQLAIFFNQGRPYELAWSAMFSLSLPTGGWQDIMGIIWALGILLLLVVGVIFLSVAAQGAAVTFAIESFKKGKADANKAWHRGVKHFWRVLAINLLRKALSLTLILAVLYVFQYLAGAGTGLAVALFLLLCVLFFIYVGVYAVSVFALGYAVAANDSLYKAVTRGCRLFFQHVLVSIEIGILLVLLNIFLVAVIFFSFFFAFIPSIVVWIFAGLANSAALIALGSILGLLLWLVLSVCLTGVFHGYNISVWMYLFLKMHKEGIASRLLHHLGRAFGLS